MQIKNTTTESKPSHMVWWANLGSVKCQELREKYHPGFMLINQNDILEIYKAQNKTEEHNIGESVYAGTEEPFNREAAQGKGENKTSDLAKAAVAHSQRSLGIVLLNSENKRLKEENAAMYGVLKEVSDAFRGMTMINFPPHIRKTIQNVDDLLMKIIKNNNK